MKLFNKFVQSVKEPQNKSDIWFDGKVLKVYQYGEWQQITHDINSTILKYLANPFVISYGKVLPDDLKEVVITSGMPNEKIIKLCLLAVDRDDDGEIWIEPITGIIDDFIQSASGRHFYYVGGKFLDSASYKLR